MIDDDEKKEQESAEAISGLKMYHYTTICKHISAFFTQFPPFQLIYKKKTE